MSEFAVPILCLTGADAVGKSTVAWEIYDVVTSAGVGAAFIDVDYLGFCTPPARDEPLGPVESSPASGWPNDQLVESNLASMWPHFQTAGAGCLVMAGIVVTVEQRDRIQALIPHGDLTLCRLRATPETLAARIMHRGQIDGVGTDAAVSGLTLHGLEEQSERAAAFAAKQDADDIADFTVDTDNVPIPVVARRVLEQANRWP